MSAKYTVPQQISLKEQPEYWFGMRNPYWGRAHVSHKPNRDAQGCRGKSRSALGDSESVMRSPAFVNLLAVGFGYAVVLGGVAVP